MGLSSKCFLVLSSVLFLTTACTRPSSQPSPTQTPEKNITISTIGETMMFDKSNLYVKAGEIITVTFKNNASAMKHNWVLTQPGKADSVGLAAAKAGEEKSFVPDTPDVIMASKLIDKGEFTFTFKAPDAGDYPYICTFPGHYTVMKGTLHSLP